jgi:hypothetical protein
MSITLTGGQASSGQASNNTLTDSYLVLAAGNLIVTPGGGNLDVAGVSTDTDTTVLLGGINSPVASQIGDTINIALDGGDNTIASFQQPSLTPGGQLNGADVNVTVSGITGSNDVVLNNNTVSGYPIAVTNVKLGGSNNTVTLNGDATNTIVTGGAGAMVDIGLAFGNSGIGFDTTVTLSGADNTVTGDDANITVTGGVTANVVTLGNGNDTVVLGGNKDKVTVGDGNNFIRISSAGKSSVTVGNGSNHIFQYGSGATLTINSGDKLLTPPGSDIVKLNGMHDKVTENWLGYSAPADISIAGSKGYATISLSNGNDSVTADGSSNSITLGSGIDTVVANGDTNTITVGAGSDTVTDTGTGSTITLNGGPSSQDLTTIGNGDTVNGNNGVQDVFANNGDTITLNDTNFGSSVDFLGTGSSATFLGDSTFEANFSAAGNNTVTIAADGSGDFTGHAVIDGLIPGNGMLDFTGFGAPLDTSSDILLDFLTHPVAGGYTITTPGGGTVILHETQGLSTSMFG